MLNQQIAILLALSLLHMHNEIVYTKKNDQNPLRIQRFPNIIDLIIANMLRYSG